MHYSSIRENPILENKFKQTQRCDLQNQYSYTMFGLCFLQTKYSRYMYFDFTDCLDHLYITREFSFQVKLQTQYIWILSDERIFWCGIEALCYYKFIRNEYKTITNWKLYNSTRVVNLVLILCNFCSSKHSLFIKCNILLYIIPTGILN